jgi:thiol:disulfide interchange protein
VIAKIRSIFIFTFILLSGDLSAFNDAGRNEAGAFAFAESLPQEGILDPVKWSFSVEQKSKEDAILILKATIEKKFHIYSQFLSSDGPIPTTFTFDKSSDYELVGKTAEENAVVEYDPVWESKIGYFNDVAVFRQKVKIKKAGSFKIKGILNYMACNDKQCLPPTDVDFSFVLNKDAKDAPADKEIKTTQEVKDTPVAMLAPDTLHPPQAVIAPADTSSDMLEPGCGETEGAAVSETSILGIFFGGILGGLLALLTPCVFPMIPMTVSFFTKRSGSKQKGIVNAVIYAISIIVIYVGLGFLVTVTMGSDALNDLASNSFFNLAFFIVFVIFAISFFGAFEIVLPSSLINKADAASDKGGLIGIFFMAFTLSLVSFSCTGPIIGTLLVEAAHGQSYLGPLAGMTGFSVALALPFAFFAAFPGWLHSLPKSGGWLNSVKVSLGFLELALALKFLSNVDLAYHWGFLRREVFISLWVIIFALWGFYLLGKIKFAHDSDVSHVSVSRLLMSIIVFTFTIYLVPGIWGAPLRLISGFPPPEFYKEWITGTTNECPHNLTCFHDFEEGMKYAKAQEKPVMIDFTGWSCVNCRKMEDNVWSDPKILKRLSEKYVLISLYVDDKTILPEKEQYISPLTGKRIRTTGNKWSDLESTKYKTNSQPYYVLLDNRGHLLAKPRGYTPDVDTYGKFLDEGLCRYTLRKNR